MNRAMRRSLSLVCRTGQLSLLRLILLALVCTTFALAQRDLGTITGTVTDPTGAVVPNAKITIHEIATGQKFEIVTGENGDYTRPALRPGNYTIMAEAPGFRRVEQQNVSVVGGDRVGINLTLSVGEVSEAVEVSAQAPLLQTETPTLGANLDSKNTSELPLGGQRTFTFLARLSPGVLTAEPGARDAAGGGFSANGVRSNGQNNFLLNGVDNNVNVIDFLNQTAFVVGPSVEAIGEMRVLTNGYNAEYGRGAGGVINVSLKSGTNDLHGTLFHFLQNDKLNANRWEINKAGRDRPAYRQNQFGAAVGGPIIKNRTFIFGDYQGTRIASSGGVIQNLGYGGFYTIPSPAMVQGDFSELLGPQIGTDPLGRPILQGQIFDPSTTRSVGGQLVRDPFPGNVIPVGRQDPAARKIMSLYPAPNQVVPRGRYPQNNYFVSTPGRQTTNQGDVRVDHRITDQDSIFGTLSWANTEKNSESPLPGALDAANFQGVNEENLSRNAMLSYTRVWSPNTISETRIGFTRLVTSRLQGNADADLFTEMGIGGYNPTTSLNGGLPQIQFPSGSSRYSQIGANDWLPSKEYSNVWDFIQNVAINRGAHALKFGGEYRPIAFPFFQVPFPHGELSFAQNDSSFPSTGTAANGSPFNTATGDEMASFMMGQIDWGQISTTNFISSTKQAWAFYAQDDWKVTPKLTLNLGLRYELFSPIGERFGRQSNFVFDDLTLYIPKGKDQDAPLPPNFAQQFPQVRVSRGEVDQYLIPWDKWDFAPRVGIAYNVFSRTVLRAGYGIFYGGEENQGGNPNRGESAPFNFSPDLHRPAGVDAFAANPFFPGGLSGGFPSNVFSLPAPITFRSIATNFRNGLVHKWNFAIQHELPFQTALELAYVGNHQAHQLLQPDPNACSNFATTDSTINCNSLRPFPNIGHIEGTASFGRGNYHGLTAKAEKRFSHGLTFLTAYTYGHALSDTGTTLSGSPGRGSLDPRNIGTSYASASWDIRHNFTSSFQYDLPFGRGKSIGANWSRPVDVLLGNWQLNGILTLHTGNPFTLRSNACQGVWNNCMPDLVPGKDPNDAPPGGRTPDAWFDTSAVTPPAPLTGGNLGLQSNWYPATKSLDFSVFKHFRFTERFNLQFRTEATNLFNTPLFNNPDNNMQNANFGKITSTLPGTERHIQMALRLMF